MMGTAELLKNYLLCFIAGGLACFSLLAWMGNNDDDEE